MLPLQFFGQNLHFAVSLLAALVFFAVFWLYFDAWLTQRDKKGFLKWAGFLLVSVSFVVHATVIEQSVLGHSIFGDLSESLANGLRLLGYIGIVTGLIADPLQPRLQNKSLEEQLAENQPNPPSPPPAPAKTLAVAPLGSLGSLTALVLPIAGLAVAVLYWRRATMGLERHLKPAAIAFLLLFGFELVSLAGLWQDTNNPTLFDLVKPLGPLWIASHILLMAGIIVLGHWVWRYLVERLVSQLFMIFTSAVLVIFLLTTVSFTFLLLRNIQNQTLDNLETATNVLGYALDSKKAETRAIAESLSQNSELAKAIAAKDHGGLVVLTSDFLEAKKQSSLIITTGSGQVLLRAEDPDRWGDSLSSDSLLRRALIGNSSSSVAGQEGVLAPVVYIKTAVAVRDTANNLIGAVIVGLAADNALVNGIKNSTGLDSALYSGNALAATTLTAPDGKTRLVGVKQSTQVVNSEVLKNGQIFKGPVNLLNRQFLAVYAPLHDIDGSVVGMLFIGQPQISILQTAGRSIQLTFIVAIVLLILAVIPSYLIARHIARQLA